MACGGASAGDLRKARRSNDYRAVLERPGRALDAKTLCEQLAIRHSRRRVPIPCQKQRRDGYGPGCRRLAYDGGHADEVAIGRLDRGNR
jgi:hypothetical protein